MLKWNELDDTKYYYRALGKVNKYNYMGGGSEEHFYLYDFNTDKMVLYTIEAVYAMLRDENIVILGFDKVKNRLIEGDDRWACVALAILHDGTVIKNWVRDTGDGQRSCVRSEYKIMYESDVKSSPLNVAFMCKAKGTVNDIHINMENVEFDEDTIDMREPIPDLAAMCLMSFEGMTIRSDGLCILDNVNRESVSIPDGVRGLQILNGCNINELILPQTCKTFMREATTFFNDPLKRRSIQLLDLGGAHYVDLYYCSIKELHVNNTFKVLANSKYNETAVGDITGDLSLYAFKMESFEEFNIDDTVDLSRSIVKENISLNKLSCNNIILPESVKSCNIGAIIKDIKIEFNGKLKELRINSSGTANIDFVFNKGASFGVKHYLKTFSKRQ